MNPTIVVLAAGMSSRYGRPKQLEPLGPGGETLLDYSVFDGLRAGFSRVVLVIREELEGAFRDHVSGRWPRTLETVLHFQRKDDLPGFGPAPEASVEATTPPARGGRPRQERVGHRELAALVSHREKPWGTAHALLTARHLLPEPFVILNADDFYGGPAFSRAISFLRGPGAGGAPPEFALMGYTLEDTLSRHGGVNRGLCRVNSEGWMEKVEEVLNIRREGDFLQGRTLSGKEVTLTGREPVSTNFWVFSRHVFPALETGFRRFLQEELRRNGSHEAGGEAEFLIPTEVNRLLEVGDTRVRVPRAPGPFFGITHPEDRDGVVEGLRGLVEKGRYPDPLWGRGKAGVETWAPDRR